MIPLPRPALPFGACECCGAVPCLVGCPLGEAGLACGFDHGNVQLQSGGDSLQRGDARLADQPFAQPVEREPRDAGTDGECVQGLAVLDKEIVQGRRSSFGHGLPCREVCRKIPATALDEPMQLCQSVPIKRAPTAAHLSHGRAAVEATPEPESEPMEGSASVPSPSSLTYDVEVRHLSGNDCEARIAGCIAAVGVDWTPSDHSVGVGGGFSAGRDSVPVLVARAEWDAAFPGVEPTAEAIKALFVTHASEIEELAIELVEDERASSFSEPDDDGGDWGDE